MDLPGHVLDQPAVRIASCFEPAARILDMRVSAAEWLNKTVLPTSSSSDESECGKSQRRKIYDSHHGRHLEQ